MNEDGSSAHNLLVQIYAFTKNKMSWESSWDRFKNLPKITNVKWDNQTKCSGLLTLLPCVISGDYFTGYRRPILGIWEDDE